MNKKRVIIDTDMLPDHALALLLAFGSPELEVEAITCVWGRDDVTTIGENVLRVLELAGAPGVPVALGAQRNILASAAAGGRIAGHASPWNRLTPELLEFVPPPRRRLQDRHAVDLILEHVNRAPGEITLLSMGALTNIAVCLMKDPEFVAHVRSMVMMAGAAFVSGNATPAAETNVYADPEAARIVFASGVPITMVGLDVTTKVLLTSGHADRITTPKRTHVGRFVSALLAQALPHQRRLRKLDGFPLHDPLAVGVCIDPCFVRTEPIFVDVETRGELTTGATVPDRRGVWGKEPNVSVCVDVDAERFLEFFIARLSASY